MVEEAPFDLVTADVLKEAFLNRFGAVAHEITGEMVEQALSIAVEMRRSDMIDQFIASAPPEEVSKLKTELARQKTPRQ